MRTAWLMGCVVALTLPVVTPSAAAEAEESICILWGEQTRCTFTCAPDTYIAVVVISTGTPGVMLATGACGEWVLDAVGNNECMGPNGEPCIGGSNAFNRFTYGTGSCTLHSGYIGACLSYPGETLDRRLMDQVMADLERRGADLPKQV